MLESTLQEEPPKRWWDEDGPRPPWSRPPRSSSLDNSRGYTVSRPVPFLPSLQAPPDDGPKMAKGIRFGHDRFVLWEQAARTETPVSTWKELERGPRATNEARKRQEENGSLAAALLPFRPTLPGLLLGKPLPSKKLLASASESPSASLGGVWYARSDEELVGTIQNDQIVWAADGSTTKISCVAAKDRYFSMVVDNAIHTGVLSCGGNLLQWSDGDAWCKFGQEPLEKFRPKEVTTDSVQMCQGWIHHRLEPRWD